MSPDEESIKKAMQSKEAISERPAPVQAPQTVDKQKIAKQVLMFYQHRVQDMVDLNEALGISYNKSELMESELETLLKHITN